MPQFAARRVPSARYKMHQRKRESSFGLATKEGPGEVDRRRMIHYEQQEEDKKKIGYRSRMHIIR